MKVNHNEKELKKLEKTGFPNERVEKRLEMEMQQLDSAQNFRNTVMFQEAHMRGLMC